MLLGEVVHYQPGNMDFIGLENGGNRLVKRFAGHTVLPTMGVVNTRIWPAKDGSVRFSVARYGRAEHDFTRRGGEGTEGFAGDEGAVFEG